MSYVYRVRAKNSAGLWGAWSADSDGILVDTTAPAGVSVTDDGATTTSTSQLHATWTPSSDPESGIAEYQYLIAQDVPSTETTITQWTSVGLATDVTRTGLSLVDGKTYYLGVRARNRAGRYSAVAFSDGITVSIVPPATPPPDTTAPVLSALSVSAITTSGATITWTTDEPASSQVEYGPTPSYGQLSLLDATLVTTHSVTLSGLTAGTLYHYRVRSKDAAGNEALSPDASFTTAAPADTTPPTGSITINGGAAGTRDPVVALTLDARDDSGTVSQMQFSDDGRTYSTPEPYAASKTWPLPAGDGPKTVSVRFADPAGNWSDPVSASIILDTTPPGLGFLSPKDGDVLIAPSP